MTLGTLCGHGGQLTRGRGDRLVDPAPSFVPALAVQRVEANRVVLAAIAPQPVGLATGTSRVAPRAYSSLIASPDTPSCPSIVSSPTTVAMP